MRVIIVGGVLVSAVLGAGGRAVAQTPPPPISSSSSSAPGVSTGSAAASNEDVQRLRERAAAFWAARVAGDFDKQWELLEPRGRGRMTAAEYSAGRKAVKYLAYQVEDATVKGYFSTVNVRLMVQPALPVGGIVTKEVVAPSTVLVPDKWVKIRGTWYHTFGDE